MTYSHYILHISYTCALQLIRDRDEQRNHVNVTFSHPRRLDAHRWRHFTWPLFEDFPAPPAAYHQHLSGMNADGTSAGDPSFQRFHGSCRGAFVAPRASVAVAGFVVECSRGYNARDLGCESGCEFLRVRVCAVLTSHGGIWGKALYARALFSIPRPPDRRTWKEMLRGGMAEEILNDSLADLREVENKVGRKTPESLLIWMRDAADCGDGWWSDVVDRGDRSSAFGQSFSDKLRGLKQEMVKIPILFFSALLL